MIRACSSMSGLMDTLSFSLSYDIKYGSPSRIIDSFSLYLPFPEYLFAITSLGLSSLNLRSCLSAFLSRFCFFWRASFFAVSSLYYMVNYS